MGRVRQASTAPEDDWGRRWADGLSRVRGRREARLAARDRACAASRSSVGRSAAAAWRDRSRQFRAALPHLTWGTGPAVLAPFIRRAREAEAERAASTFRHPPPRRRAHGREWRRRAACEGRCSTRMPRPRRAEATGSQGVGDIRVPCGPAVVVASGGIGGDHDLVRRSWPAERLGPAARGRCSAGVPASRRRPHAADRRACRRPPRERRPHVALHRRASRTGIRCWPNARHPHPPRPLVASGVDADGRRFAPPCHCSRASTRLARLGGTFAPAGHAHSWFVLTQGDHREGVRALGFSEQNPDITGRDIQLLLKRLGKNPPPAGAEPSWRREKISSSARRSKNSVERHVRMR